MNTNDILLAKLNEAKNILKDRYPNSSKATKDNIDFWITELSLHTHLALTQSLDQNNYSKLTNLAKAICLSLFFARFSKDIQKSNTSIFLSDDVDTKLFINMYLATISVQGIYVGFIIVFNGWLKL